jgi:hypothetical protein
MGASILRQHRRLKDPFSGYRLYRISLLRDLIKSFGENRS